MLGVERSPFEDSKRAHRAAILRRGQAAWEESGCTGPGPAREERQVGCGWSSLMATDGGDGLLGPREATFEAVIEEVERGQPDLGAFVDARARGDRLESRSDP